MTLRAEKIALERAGRWVVDDVDAVFRQGAVTVVIGENGAGKTTLLNLLAGLLPTTRGRVILGQQEVRALPPSERAQRIASLGQHSVDAPGLGALSRIAQGLAPRHGPDALLDDDARRQATAVAERVGVAALLDRPLGALSGGERRRVEVARALIDDRAEVTLLDEPFAGVDVRHQPLLVEALKARAALGGTLVVSVHQLDVALSLADEVLALKAGRVVAHGPVAEAFTDAILDETFGVRPGIVRALGPNSTRLA